MTHKIGILSEPRALTASEQELATWLLEHGTAEAGQYLGQLNEAKVFAHCKCGCASVDFAIDGNRPKTFAMRVLADFQWTGDSGHLFGVFVFEQDGLLAGIDLWSIDGMATPVTLPALGSLVPYGTPAT